MGLPPIQETTSWFVLLLFVDYRLKDDAPCVFCEHLQAKVVLKKSLQKMLATLIGNEARHTFRWMGFPAASMGA